METMRDKNAQHVNKQFLNMEMISKIGKKIYLHRRCRSPEIITETHALCNDLGMGTINVASDIY
jgi:hypothetical protein